MSIIIYKTNLVVHCIIHNYNVLNKAGHHALKAGVYVVVNGFMHKNNCQCILLNLNEDLV